MFFRASSSFSFLLFFMDWDRYLRDLARRLRLAFSSFFNLSVRLDFLRLPQVMSCIHWLTGPWDFAFFTLLDFDFLFDLLLAFSSIAGFFFLTTEPVMLTALPTPSSYPSSTLFKWRAPKVVESALVCRLLLGGADPAPTDTALTALLCLFLLWLVPFLPAGVVRLLLSDLLLLEGLLLFLALTEE